jgi:hypothetical protein
MRQQDWLTQQRIGLEHLLKQIKSELANTTQQIEAFLNLQSILSGRFELPPMHGWPISPDFALLFVRRILDTHYDLIVEFGSGTSTVLIAHALNNKTNEPHGKTVFLAFEHLQSYFEQTQKNLEQRKLANTVNLIYTPLKPYVAASGAHYPYYSCHESLNEIAKSMHPGSRILVLVDGPPSSTGKHARWPALEIITNVFNGVQIDFLLDDFIREDEQQVVISWEKIALQKNWSFSTTRYRMEKDACLMQLQIPVSSTELNN